MLVWVLIEPPGEGGGLAHHDLRAYSCGWFGELYAFSLGGFGVRGLRGWAAGGGGEAGYAVYQLEGG